VPAAAPSAPWLPARQPDCSSMPDKHPVHQLARQPANIAALQDSVLRTTQRCATSSLAGPAAVCFLSSAVSRQKSMGSCRASKCAIFLCEQPCTCCCRSLEVLLHPGQAQLLSFNRAPT
jgi:hypothetical protein